MGTISIIMLVVAGSLIYFFPAIVAVSRGRRNSSAIFILNFLAGLPIIFSGFAFLQNQLIGLTIFLTNPSIGWFFAGWTVALTWAFIEDSNAEHK